MLYKMHSGFKLFQCRKFLCDLCRFEGPSCNIDVNECSRGTAGCAAHAGCINSNGGYTCTCYWGYDGVLPISLYASSLFVHKPGLRDGILLFDVVMDMMCMACTPTENVFRALFLLKT